MSNPFFTWSFDVAPGSTNRSRPVENEFAAIGTGFDKVGAYFSRLALAPDGETMAALPALADRRNKAAVWDASGNWAVTVSATSAEMQAAIEAATTAGNAAAAAAASALSVQNSTSYIQQLMLVQGVK